MASQFDIHGFSYGNNNKPRSESFKISLTESEMGVFSLNEKKIKQILEENGLLYNQPEFFRTLLLNFDNPEFVSLMSKLYRKRVSPAFHITKEGKK